MVKSLDGKWGIKHASVSDCVRSFSEKFENAESPDPKLCHLRLFVVTPMLNLCLPLNDRGCNRCNQHVTQRAVLLPEVARAAAQDSRRRCHPLRSFSTSIVF